MTDRELLEAAAKAAGIEWLQWCESWDSDPTPGYQLTDFSKWNPLTDDGDALRLAVKLGIDVTVSGKHAAATGCKNGPCFQEYANGDLCAATRRAIVRAAAVIGAKS